MVITIALNFILELPGATSTEEDLHSTGLFTEQDL